MKCFKKIWFHGFLLAFFFAFFFFSFSRALTDSLDHQPEKIIVNLSNFGAKGDGSDDTRGFYAFRKWALNYNERNPKKWIVLNLSPDKSYHYSDPYFFLGIDHLEVQGHNSTFANTQTASKFDIDKTPLVVGGFGYIDLVTPRMAQLGYWLNKDAFLIESAQTNDRSITLKNPKDSAHFKPGYWALVSSQICYYRGSPPAMKYFDYVLVDGIDKGVISFSSTPLTHSHSSTLPAHLKSGNFDCRASIFPLPAFWNVWQKYYDLTIEGDHPKEVLSLGKEVEMIGCNLPGYAPSACGNFKADHCEIRAQIEVDKLVAGGTIENCSADERKSWIGPTCSTGPVTLDNDKLILAGTNGMGSNVIFKDCSLEGDAIFAYSSDGQLTLMNNSLVSGKLCYRDYLINQSRLIENDGRKIKYEPQSGILTVPYSWVLEKNHRGVIENFFEGAVCETAVAEGARYVLDGRAVTLVSYTDDEENLYMRFTPKEWIRDNTLVLEPWIKSYYGTGNSGGIINGNTDAVYGR
jgi:hypothetical protein